MKRRKICRVRTTANFADVAAQDVEYWKKQSVAARLRAMALMRQINDGDAATGRMEMVLELVTYPPRTSENSGDTILPLVIVFWEQCLVAMSICQRLICLPIFQRQFRSNLGY